MTQRARCAGCEGGTLNALSARQWILLYVVQNIRFFPPPRCSPLSESSGSEPQMDQRSVRHRWAVPGLVRIDGGAPFPLRLPMHRRTMVYSMQPTHRVMHSRTAKPLLNRPELSLQLCRRRRCPANTPHLGRTGRIQRRQAQGLCSIKCMPSLVFPPATSAMNVEPRDLFLVGSYVQFERSDGIQGVAEIKGLSERCPKGF